MTQSTTDSATTRHLIIVETPDNPFVPSANPTTEQVVEAIQNGFSPGTWWQRSALVRGAEES